MNFPHTHQPFLSISGSLGSSLTAKQQKLFLFYFTLCLFRFLTVSSGCFVRLHPLFVTVVAVAFGVGQLDGYATRKNRCDIVEI